MHLDEQDLVKRCFNIIDNETRAVLSSQSFRSISIDTLQKLVERDSLVGATEIEIFSGCVNWAKQECTRKDTTNSPENIRTMLGKVLYLIRFPLMSVDAFSNQVTTTGILDKDETLFVFLYLTRHGTNKDDQVPVFSIKNRQHSNKSVEYRNPDEVNLETPRSFDKRYEHVPYRKPNEAPQYYYTRSKTRDPLVS